MLVPLRASMPPLAYGLLKRSRWGSENLVDNVDHLLTGGKRAGDDVGARRIARAQRQLPVAPVPACQATPVVACRCAASGVSSGAVLGRPCCMVSAHDFHNACYGSRHAEGYLTERETGWPPLCWREVSRDWPLVGRVTAVGTVWRATKTCNAKGTADITNAWC